MRRGRLSKTLSVDRYVMRGKQDLVIVGLIWATVSVLGVILASAIRLVPVPATREAAAIDRAFTLFLQISVPIFALIVVLVLYSAFRFRVRGEPLEDGPPLHSHTGLEGAWILGSSALVLGLAFYGWQELNHYRATGAGRDTVIVQVEAGQWYWRYSYPEYGVVASDLWLPRGRPVFLEMKTLDVIHSFWVPAFLSKQDLVPGRTVGIRLTPEQPGTYDVVCAELCGLAHGQMRSKVVIVEPAEFEAWLVEQTNKKTASPVEAGRELFRSQGCVGCHALSDAKSTASVGPSLDGLAGRAGTRKPGLTDEQYIREHILSGSQGPACCAPGYPPIMPAFKGQLADDQVEALVRYLLEVTSR